MVKLTIFIELTSMTITILTPNGQATINNSQSKQGQKAMLNFMRTVQAEKTPFIVLPPKTTAHDLIELTSVDNVPNYD